MLAPKLEESTPAGATPESNGERQTPRAGSGRSMLAAICVTACLIQAIAGVIWWCANLTAVPAYGDTVEYLFLARTLRVDAYRTVFYPGFLRLSEVIATGLHAPLTLIVYPVQTAVAAAAAFFLVATLWKVTASERPELNAVPALRRRIVIITATVFLTTLPLIEHYAESILTDSLSVSFLVVALSSVIRIGLLRDTRVRELALAFVSVGAAEFVRPEKVYLLILTVATVLVVAVRLGRRAVSNRVATRIVAAWLLLIAVLPAAAVTAVDRSTQTADLGRPALTVSELLFSRTTWPHLEQIRPYLSTKLQTIITEDVARTVDSDSNNIPGLVVQLRAAAGGTDALLNDVTHAALRCCWQGIASTTALDTVEYSMVPFVYPFDLLTHRNPDTAWNNSRMSMAHPTLTVIYTRTSFAALAALLTVLLFVAVASRGSRPWRRRIMVWGAVVLVEAVLLNAVMFATESGAYMNIRYGMPSYLIINALLVWIPMVAIGGRIRSDDAGREAS